MVGQIRLLAVVQHVQRERVRRVLDEAHARLRSEPVEDRIDRRGDGIDPGRKGVDDLTQECHRNLVAACVRSGPASTSFCHDNTRKGSLSAPSTTTTSDAVLRPLSKAICTRTRTAGLASAVAPAWSGP